MAAAVPAPPRRRHVGAALFLAVLSLPVAYLYVRRPGRAAIYLVLALLVPLGAFVLAGAGVWPAGLSWRWVAGLLIVLCAVDAGRIALGYADGFDGPWYTRWWGLMAVLVLLAAMLGGVRAFVIDTFRNPSEAMLPTLRVDDEFLVRKYPGAPRRGDVVVHLAPEDSSIHYVKRIVGLPGDVVLYDPQMKRLTINGEAAGVEVIEPYHGEPSTDVVRETIGGRVHFQLLTRGTVGPGGTYEVPAGHYFVLGDHRDNSNDSRYYGFVPHDSVVGIATRVWWNTDEPTRAGIVLE